MEITPTSTSSWLQEQLDFHRKHQIPISRSDHLVFWSLLPHDSPGLFQLLWKLCPLWTEQRIRSRLLQDVLVEHHAENKWMQQFLTLAAKQKRSIYKCSSCLLILLGNLSRVDVDICHKTREHKCVYGLQGAGTAARLVNRWALQQHLKSFYHLDILAEQDTKWDKLRWEVNKSLELVI